MSAERGAEVRDAIYVLGGAWMLSDEAKVVADEVGTGRWALYMAGRGGVLGDVHPDVVTAAFYFFPASSVHKGWNKALAVMTPSEAARRFATASHAWGRAHLAGVDGLEALDTALATVIDSAPVAGLPLFAGWRAMPLPDDLPARVIQRCQVLREHRGGAHAAAVLSCGLGPLEAIMAGPGYGEETARFFQWPEPYPDGTPFVEQHRRAEELTNEIVGRAWAVLSDGEFAAATETMSRASERVPGWFGKYGLNSRTG